VRYLKQFLIASVLVLAMPALRAATSPGETSAPPLAPLVVEAYDKASGDLHLAYQTACGATGNTIYYAPMGQAGGPVWTGNDCGASASGTHTFHAGSGSYFFVIAGSDGVKEGSYGKARFGAALVERTPYAANTCGLGQELANTCVPAAMGAACTSNADCGARTTCLANATGGGQCGCLPPFTGSYCQQCAPGYTGPDCRSCAAGYVGNAMQTGDAGDAPVDRTHPETFRCEPDVIATCTGVSCGAHGSCVVSGRDAVCACQPGYTGAGCGQCAPNYELNATGACVLGAACRADKCGGHGSCLSASFGDVVCQCDSGYPGPDCGGAPLRVVSSSEASTLYPGESVVLTPQGGTPPYTWRLEPGTTAQLIECPARNSDPACPTGSVKITAPSAEPLTDGLLMIRYLMGDAAQLEIGSNLGQVPSDFLPMSGPIHVELVPFYNAMQKFMRGRGIRGGVLGISKAGIVVATNGYGYTNPGLDGDPFENAGEGGPIVQPHAPFRIASVTKTMTAAAVRQAAADAGVNITSTAPFHRAASWVQDSLGFDLVNGVAPYDYNLGGAGTDARWGQVTIQHLLNHHVGFWRDSVLAAAPGLPAYNVNLLPFTSANTPSGLQSAASGWSNDISYATSHVLAGLQLSGDPRVTVENTILFAAGNTFQYTPGGPVGQGDNYANIGYQLAGRVLEGLAGVTYNPNDASAPEGWGRFPTLLQDYLCASSGIQTGIWPGDAFHPKAGEPYYRDVDANGNESVDWNLAQPSKIRFNNGAQQWEFCQSNCGGPGETWGTSANTPTAYGGVWLAQRNSAGGLVATTDALLKFARNHRIKVGAPGDGASGIGSLLDAPGVYGSGGAHNGALPGTSSLLWQMGGNRTNRLPQPVGAWELDGGVPLPLDVNGNVRINEVTFGASTCNLPNDVAVAAIFNQRQDRRAPSTLNNPAFNATGNSSNATVYNRILDFLGDAACKTNLQGWPVLAEPPAQIQMVPDCD